MGHRLRQGFNRYVIKVESWLAVGLALRFRPSTLAAVLIPIVLPRLSVDPASKVRESESGIWAPMHLHKKLPRLNTFQCLGCLPLWRNWTRVLCWRVKKGYQLPVLWENLRKWQHPTRGHQGWHWQLFLWPSPWPPETMLGGSTVPQDMWNSKIVTLYKSHSDCKSYHGIFLLSMVEKTFTRFVPSRLQILAEHIPRVAILMQSCQINNWHDVILKQPQE